jgi:hypothetical protein
VRWEAGCVLFLGVIHGIGEAAGVVSWQGLCMDRRKPRPSWERVSTVSRADHDYRGKNGVWARDCGNIWTKEMMKDEENFTIFLLVSLVPTHCRSRGLLSTWSLTWTHTHTHTFGMTSLNERSARRRNLYLYNTKHLQEKNIHAPRWDSKSQSQQASGHRPTP